MKRHDVIYGDLGRHVRQFLEFYSGRRKSDHLTEEQYRQFLAHYPPDMPEQWGRFLDNYEIA